MRRGRYIRVMAHSYLLFDFGTDEELAQQARQRLEGWKQAFRLDRKLLLKFERSAPPESVEPKGEAKGGKKSKKAEKAEKQEAERIQLLVRLDFSDHEKLSHTRWLDRIPSEAPFKDAAPKIIRQGDADFDAFAKRFDELTDARRHSRGESAPLGT
jgi:hypothetical protein